MKHKFSYKANSKEFSLVSGLIPSPSRETFALWMLHLAPKLPQGDVSLKSLIIRTLVGTQKVIIIDIITITRLFCLFGLPIALWKG